MLPNRRHGQCSAPTIVWIAVALLGAAADASTVAGQLQDPFPALPPDHHAGDGLVRPCLAEIDGHTLCGRFRVFENRTARRGRTVDIAFVVEKALDRRPDAGVFVPLDGGPGAPTTPSAAALAEAWANIRAERDILLVDHRGTGSSGALSCDIPFPGGVASRMATPFPLDHVIACRDILSSRADLSQYTTANSVDDLADLTAWLGYAQLDLIGGSYGTREALVFTRRHPERVRTVILNGVAPVEDKTYLHHARDLQSALDALAKECAAQPECHDSFPDFWNALGDVYRQTVEDPPRVEVDGEMVRFGSGALAYALRGLLYADAGALPARVAEARSGDWLPLARYYLARQGWVGSSQASAGYHLSVLCAEDIGRVSWDEIARETKGTYLGDFLIASYMRACSRWPSARLPDSHFDAVASDKPILLLAGERDPVTPPAGAEAVSRLWPNSLVVLVPNGGHGQSGPCVDSMILEFLRTASVTGIDERCVRHAPPTRFEIREGRLLPAGPDSVWSPAPALRPNS